MNDFCSCATRTAMQALLLAVITGCLVNPQATAATLDPKFETILVYGDSLSDTGNVLTVSQGLAAGPPYFGGRLSNGPLWVERLAERLGLGNSSESMPFPAPSLVGGTNYAFGGAQAGRGFSPTACATIDGARTCVPNIGTQITLSFAQGLMLDGDELLVVQGGTNNYSGHLAAIQITDHVATLAAAGGKYFVVPNMKRLSQDPRAVYQDAYYDQFVAEFDATLEMQLDALEAKTNIVLFRLNWTALTDDIIQSPELFGLVNVTEPACPGCGSGFPDADADDTVVSNPNEYLYWDDIHYTSAINQIMGDMAADVVEAKMATLTVKASGVPEPGSLTLYALGLLVLRSQVRHFQQSRFFG